MGGFGLSVYKGHPTSRRVEKTIEVAAQSRTDPRSDFWKQLDDEILYLRLDNFMDEGAISRVYQECLPMMTEVKFLLIDVRQNGGGTDSLYSLYYI